VVICFFSRRFVPLRTFAKGVMGATTVEIALLTALGICLTVLTLDALGASVNAAFGATAATLAGDASQAMRETTAADVSPLVEASHGKSASLLPGRYHVAGISGVACLMVCSGVALQVVQRRKVKELERRATILPVACPTAQATFVAKRQDIFRSLLGDLESFLTDNVRVRHLMTSDVVTVGPAATFEEMQELMKKHEMRHLLVVDGRRTLLGVVSDRDLRGTASQKAADVMTAHPNVCSPETPVRAAVTMLLQSHISSLPVMEGERLVGILTMSDVGMALQCMLQLVERVTGDMSSDPKIAAALLGKS
jgi:CBS domain-containing protein/Flp pilus assembly pilin Flp